MTEVLVPSPTQEQLVETLEAGAEVVRQGWTQGTAWTHPDDGPLQFCATGAMFEALHLRNEPTKISDPAYMSRRALYVVAIRAFEKYLGCDVPEWNDAEERTQDEVVDAMRNCAKELANGQLVVDENVVNAVRETCSMWTEMEGEKL